MNFLLPLGITIIGSFLSVFGIYNFVPTDFLQLSPPRNLGSSITTIAGGDTLSSSRTVINDNFSALNSTKMENSTTSVAAITTLANLVTVGTITSGVWSGTAILPAKGGTGSTTLSANQVLLGNGTGNIGVVGGWGSLGQFLTSNGGTSAPSWQTSAVALNDTYQWGGIHTFNATTTIAASSTQNSLVLNGLPYTFPAVAGVASSTLMNNGSGALAWTDAPVRFLYLNSNVNVSTAASATTTLLTVPIPANTYITPNKKIRYDFSMTMVPGGGADCRYDLQYGSGSASTTLAFNLQNTEEVVFKGDMYATSTASQAFTTMNYSLDYRAFGDAPVMQTPTMTGYPLTSATYLALRARSPGAGTTCRLYGATVELLTI